MTGKLFVIGTGPGNPDQLTPEALKSRGKNSPWQGYMMSGQIRATLVGGRVVYQMRP